MDVLMDVSGCSRCAQTLTMNGCAAVVSTAAQSDCVGLLQQSIRSPCIRSFSTALDGGVLRVGVLMRAGVYSRSDGPQARLDIRDADARVL